MVAAGRRTSLLVRPWMGVGAFVVTLLLLGGLLFTVVERNSRLEEQWAVASWTESTRSQLNRLAKQLRFEFDDRYAQLIERTSIDEIQDRILVQREVSNWAVSTGDGVFLAPSLLRGLSTPFAFTQGFGLTRGDPIEALAEQYFDAIAGSRSEADRRAMLLSSYDALTRERSFRLPETLRQIWVREIQARIELLGAPTPEWDARWLQLEERATAVTSLRSWGVGLVEEFPRLRAAQRARVDLVGSVVVVRPESGTLLWGAPTRIPRGGDEEAWLWLEVDSEVWLGAFRDQLGAAARLVPTAALDLTDDLAPRSEIEGTGWSILPASGSRPDLATIRSRRARLLTLSGLAVLLVLVAAGVVLYTFARHRQLERVRASLLAHLSHELKTPLSVIRLSAETLALQRARDPARAQHYAEVILRETDRLHRMALNALAFTRVHEAPRSTRTTFSLGALVSELLEGFSLRVEESGFDCRARISHEPILIEGQREGLEHAIGNLLDNALKYGAKRLEVIVESRDRFGVVQVIDGGGGVPASERSVIFERFHRGSDALSALGSGSGLGLSITREIVEAHDGRVTCLSDSSGSGGGAVFEVRLPKVARSSATSEDGS